MLRKDCLSPLQHVHMGRCWICVWPMCQAAAAVKHSADMVISDIKKKKE